MTFEAAKDDWPAYLDIVARGVIWALGEKEEGLFNDGQGGEAPDLSEMITPKVKRIEFGQSLLSDAELSAFSLPSLPQDGFKKVIDGDSMTFWKLAGNGPGSLMLELLFSQMISWA